MKLIVGSIKSKSFKVLFLIFLLVVAGSGFYYFKFIKGKTIVQQKGSKEISFPVYSILQNEEAKVVAYDYENKKHLVLFTMPYKNPGEFQPYEFHADISSDGKKIVYSDHLGINVYNIDTKETKQIIKNKIRDEKANIPPEDMQEFNERSTDPVWSYDDSRIFYKTYGYEWVYMSVINEDGSSPQRIENSSGTIAYSVDSSDYVIGNYNDMSGEYGLFANASDPFYKTTSLLSEKDSYGITSLALGNSNNIYFAGVKNSTAGEEKTETEIAVLNRKTNQLSVLLKESNDVRSMSYVSGSGSLYFNKINPRPDGDGKQVGLGVFSLELSEDSATEFYKEGDNQISIEGEDKDFIVLRSKPPVYAPEAISKIILIGKENKNTVVLGEANKISFSGWIAGDTLPAEAATIETPSPTKQELDDYEYSQKSKENLFRTFYNYCWDYDCNSKTYPYSANKTSKKPEIVNISTKPNLLTGNISVPVVFLQFDDKSIPNYQLNAFKDEGLYNSMASLSRWINVQASKYNQKLNFEFEYKDPVTISKSSSCVEYEGVNKYYSSKCISEAINKKYPDIINEQLVLFSLGRIYSNDNSDNFNLRSTYSLSEKNVSYLLSTWGIQTRTGLGEVYDVPENDFRSHMDSKDSGYAWWFHSPEILSKFFSSFGAQLKKATYKEPVNQNSAACYAGEKNDIMCSQYLENGINKYYYNFNEMIIGDITRKELGWYDMDGDGVREVDEK